ncbi:MAG: sugar ABC transporter substrate-binding protein [Candidatus Competibacteraceae bacterium]|nr:sugar ABC transporter substrate-binding protein [Candidatus Competibacteraceae bacterium]
MGRKSLSILLALVTLLLLVGGCGESADKTQPTAPSGASTSSTPVTQPAPVPTVALVMKTLTNPFFVDMEKGAREAKQELGIELQVKTAAQETSIEQQIQIVEELIHAKIDALVIAPGDSLELIPVLKKAQDAGIEVINIDNRLDPEYSTRLHLRPIPFISVDNEQGAYTAAKWISDRISAPTKAAIIEGIRDAANAEARRQGALRAFAENPAITVVASETAHWKIDEAYQVAKKLFGAHPDIGALFCANDMMALGALKYLDEQGNNQVLVASFDALEPAKAAIRAGKLAATVDQQAAQQGYLGVQYAMRALAGETLPMETLIDTRLITADTLP